MSNSFIGQYLLNKGFLNQQQLDQALTIQQTCNIRLGQLSIDHGYLNAKQVVQINQSQRLLNKKFGDIAVEKKLLTSSQVNELLFLQKQRRRLLGSILIEEGFIDDQMLERALLAQRHHQHILSQSISKKLVDHTQRKVVQTIQTISEKLFLRCLHSHFKVKSFAYNIRELNEAEHLACIQINHSSKKSLICMAIDNITLMKIGPRFMQIPVEDCDMELAKDATGELLNCAAGYVINEVMPAQDNATPSTPYYVDKLQDLEAEEKTIIAVNFLSEAGGGAIIVGLM